MNATSFLVSSSASALMWESHPLLFYSRGGNVGVLPFLKFLRQSPTLKCNAGSRDRPAVTSLAEHHGSHLEWDGTGTAEGSSEGHLPSSVFTSGRLDSDAGLPAPLPSIPVPHWAQFTYLVVHSSPLSPVPFEVPEEWKWKSLQQIVWHVVFWKRS